MQPLARVALFSFVLLAIAPSCFAAKAEPASPPLEGAPATLDGKSFLTIPGKLWPLLWHDEFTEASLDKSRWNIGLAWTGDDGTRRHHNSDYASYIADDNAVVKDHALYLLTRKQEVKDGHGHPYHYTQGFIQTEGKFAYTYGYAEIRAKAPTEAGPGLWPAFWTLSHGFFRSDE